jgi:hypothetical protein
MDGDDISLPGRLEREVSLLESHPEIGLVGTWCIKVDTKTGHERVQSLPEYDSAIRRFMIVDNPVIHSSVMFRKDVLDSPENITSTARRSREFWELLKIQWKAGRQIGLRTEGVIAMTKSLAKACGYGIYGQ